MRKRKFTFIPHPKFCIRNIFILSAFTFLLASCLFLVLPVSLSAIGELKVGVLELRNEAEITDQEAKYLTDRVRDVASRSLARRGFLVMTRENIKEMLPPGMDLAKCTTASCEVEVGRKVGADYIVTGEILRYAGDFRANIKAHYSESGQFLGAEVARADKLKDLESSVSEASARLFALIRRHSGKSIPTQPGASEGAIGETGPGAWDFNAAQKTVVRFECDPKEAVVTVDGKLLCRSTPCSKTLPVGAATVSMDAERYKRKEKTINIAQGMKPISFKLDPNFGWLSVNSEPSGLTVTIDGKDAGRTPISDMELDPGSYEVLVTDPRYYDKGERVNITVGKSRTVSVTLPAREGGIDVSATDENGNALSGEVFVDGRKVGDAPGTHKVLIGKHKIEVRTKSGSWKGEVEVKERKVETVVAKVKGAAAVGASNRKIELHKITLKHKVLRFWKEGNDPNGLGAEIILKENLEETKPETIIAFLQGRGRKNKRSPVVIRVFTSEQAWQEEKDEAWGDAFDAGYLAYYKRVKNGDHFLRWMQKTGPYAYLQGKLIDFTKPSN
jgi:TolB-like protein